MKLITVQDIERDWNEYKQRIKLKSEFNEEISMIYFAEITGLHYEYDQEDGYFDCWLYFTYEGEMYHYTYSLIAKKGHNQGFISKNGLRNWKYEKAEKILDAFYLNHYEDLFREYRDQKIKYKEHKK